MLFKNTASQRVRFFAFDATTGLPKTGDAANITGYVAKDYGAVTALADTSATEEDSTNAKGYYWCDISQTETNADNLMVTAKSSTSNVVVVGAPAVIATRPPNAGALSIDSSGRVDVIKVAGTTQTARDLGASVLLSSGTGTGQISLSSGAVLLQATQTGVTIPTVTTVGTLTTYTGNTPQTGDAYARLGAPAGASVSADVAAVKTDTGNLVTRITSTLFSGITSLAQWLGLLAGKQTGNSTARTEVRATGAGSGTFDETTDSQEALRDRGDTAWVTATGFALAADYTTARAANLDNLSGGAVALASATADIQSRLPAALTGAGNMKADTLRLGGQLVVVPVSPVTISSTVAAVGSAMTLTSAYDAAKTAAQASDVPTAAANAAAVLAAAVTELSAVPGASPTVAQALALLYMALRNQLDVTAAAKTVHTDGGTALGAKALSDDGTTYTEAKMA